MSQGGGVRGRGRGELGCLTFIRDVPFNQNFRNFANSSKWYRIFPGKFPEIPETVEFPKCELFNKNCRISGSKVEWKETFPEKICETFGHTSRGCPLFWKSISFGRNRTSCRNQFHLPKNG